MFQTKVFYIDTKVCELHKIYCALYFYILFTYKYRPVDIFQCCSYILYIFLL